jgi:hypothetical protein
MRRCLLATVCLGLTAAAWSPPAVLADGDPASDVLLGANVFYPYSPPVAPRLQRTLNGETSAAARAHFRLKVALINGPFDLGVVPQMFSHPQEYARFLDQELRLFLGPHPALLVVMPGGYGVQGLPGPAANAVASLPRPAGRESNDLARAAIAAVPKLAAAAGHPISAADSSQGASGGGGTTLTLVILALAAIALAAAVLLLRHRLARRG